ncbi:MAG: hypothetical protein GF400_09280 [Candidatus Eisenbacteria bacterium]|nr:hypothetical protein [Candidatus Eisenbacteria bacterium]
MRQHTTPGQLCRIKAPRPEDEKEERYETGPDGMVKDIGEPVAVLARFSKGQIDPLRFKWHKRIYDVDRVSGKWEEREGQYKLYYFAVVTDVEDYYELIYSTRTMGWTLSRTDME